ncbi:hypothetical protein [Ralstonia solanacearum]|uniref:hypothetical protein n=1 Tax=Ralstonia solanacearum TaxID=305 RepID=UPI0012D356BE|nr:hypothetical protein [Ralstonia solanacearum]
MKILIEVLAQAPINQESWPQEVKEQGGFLHNDLCESKIFAVLGEDNKSITASVFQAPIFVDIPQFSLLKITKID